MTSDNDNKAAHGMPDPAQRPRAREQQPEWAQGLRKLYDEVVDEPLPDQFKDLLSQLDSKG